MRGTGAGLSLIYALAAGPCFGAPAGQGDNVETVVVTAEKRAESLQDLPIAISAYSGETLVNAGVGNLRDLQTQAPSLNIGAKGSETFVTIRGIGSEIASIGSEPGVTLSEDGVVLASHLMFDADFLDVARVEVLRGPQGTISGRNATGGAINIISKQPTDAVEATLLGGFGNYDHFETEAILSGPLVGDRLLGRIAFSSDNQDGWIRNTLLGEKLGSENKVHGRATLKANLAPGMDLVLEAEGLLDHGKPQSTANIGRARPDVPSLGEQFGVPDFDIRHLRLKDDQARLYSRGQFALSARITWAIRPSTTLTATTAYLKTDIHDAQDTDGTSVSLGDFPFWDWNLWQISQELTLATDLTDRLDLILGGLYLRDSAQQPLEFVAKVLGILPGNYFVFPDQDLSSYAGYGQLRFRLTDALRLSAGLRYTRDDKSYFENGVIFAPIAGGGKKSWNALTPRFALDYQASDAISLYANVARGFKAGGFNTLNFAPVNIFNPEYVWNYEAGAKGSLFDGRLSGAAAMFYMDYTNLQETVYTPGPFGVPVAGVKNVPKATIKGIELELDGHATDALVLGFSATWLETRVGRFLSVDPVYPELGTQNFAGNRLARSPEWQFTGSAEYTTALGSDYIGSVRADYSWRSHQFFEIFNHPLVAQGAYGLLNVNVAVETADAHWRLSAYGRNVTDVRYRNNGFASVIIPGIPMNLASIGDPATYGVRVSYKY